MQDLQNRAEFTKLLHTKRIEFTKRSWAGLNLRSCMSVLVVGDLQIRIGLMIRSLTDCILEDISNFFVLSIFMLLDERWHRDRPDGTLWLLTKGKKSNYYQTLNAINWIFVNAFHRSSQKKFMVKVPQSSNLWYFTIIVTELLNFFLRCLWKIRAIHWQNCMVVKKYGTKYYNSETEF